MTYRYLSSIVPISIAQEVKANSVLRFLEQHPETDSFECSYQYLPLELADLQIVLDNYKKDNGTYFYQGEQVKYEWLREQLSKELARVECIITTKESEKDE